MSEPAPELEGDAPDPLLGAILGGRYRILERLGEGGMGAVYRAEHLELEREVAVKTLAPELSTRPVNVERFQREARTASKIGHPNIVDVFDLGRAADGTPYLVMERLEGRDLDEELAATDGTLPPARVIEVLRPVASALDACHARGVIHRDVKPSNIFLARLGDGSLSPKVVDFGLAMLTSTDARLTQAGYLSGTPHYLPPEAAHGDLPGAAGDVYALATIAFEALCGALPFDAENPNGVLVQKVTMDPPRMAEVAGGEFPEAVELVLQRGLHPEPAKRYATATELVDELARAIGESSAAWGPGAGGAARPRLTYEEYRNLSRAKVSAVRELEASAPPPARPAASRAPLFAALAGALAVSAVLALGLFAWWGAAEPAPPIAPATPPPVAAPDPTPPAPIEREPPRGEEPPVIAPPPVVEEAVAPDAVA
ncbi:MAG: serine/threonine protein kinase, partial [Sandaracinaceae bacterium]|nr:serine/threonine protein kinase [Sandaracinaceae bacterium]